MRMTARARLPRKDLSKGASERFGMRPREFFLLKEISIFVSPVGTAIAPKKEKDLERIARKKFQRSNEQPHLF